MISICIPIYNFQVIDLVTELGHQAQQLNINYEIICIDDASEKKWKEKNKSLNDLSNVHYHELESNVGRSKIRNLLAQKSKFELLLFMDCDSAILSNKYLSNYLKNLDLIGVVYGGRAHDNTLPKNKSFYLRWLYGKKREDQSVSQRKESPYLSFKSNNFLISKKTLLNNQFNESFIGYGHEDTLFAQQLKENEITIHHINNPIIHVGLENAEEFLLKTREGLKNLIKLMKKKPALCVDIKLIKTYKKLKKYKLTFIIKLMHPALIVFLEKRLLSSNPKLFYFDVYKLTFLIHYLK